MTDRLLDLQSERQAALQSAVLLLSPTLSYWRGSYQLSSKKTSILLSGHTVEANSVTTPHCVLLTDQYPRDRANVPWKKRLQSIASRHVAVVERYSVAFPIRGVRIIPKSRGDAFFRELFGPSLGGLRREYLRNVSAYGEGHDLTVAVRNRFKHGSEASPGCDDTCPIADELSETQSVAYELRRATVEFGEDLSRILRDIQEHTDAEVWEDVKHKIPRSPKDMCEKFNLDVVPIELAGSAESREVTSDDLAAHADVVRAACQRKVSEAIENMIAEPRQQLADAIAQLAGLVDRSGRVTAKSFRPITSAIEKIRAFAFIANSELLERITELETRLDHTLPSSLTAATLVTSGLSTLLTDVADAVNDASQHQADFEHFGRARRRVQAITPMQSPATTAAGIAT